MSFGKYRHRVQIMRRKPGSTSVGGYNPDEYELIGETSAEVRDESPAEYAAAESAGIEHVRTFTMRAREIRTDDVLVWQDMPHSNPRVDGVYNLGREIRVRVSMARSRYSVKGANHGTP